MRVVFAGGGTGGHVYPAIAIASELKRLDPGAEILYVGTDRGLEASLVPKEGIPFRSIRASGLRGKTPGAAARGLAALAAGFVDSRRILSSFRPDVLVGTGGYVSVPTVLAGKTFKIPCVLQEQNAVPGAANRWLSRVANCVCVPHGESARLFPQGARILVTGNPVRSSVLEGTKEQGLERFGFDGLRPIVLVLGGSRGARRLVECTLELAEMARSKGQDFGILLSTGEQHHEDALRFLSRIGGVRHGNIRVERYIDDMGGALAMADLVVARAGAITLAEIAARGKPSVLVPSPNVAGNHQASNARVLQRRGAAVVIDEREMSGSKLLGVISELLAQPGRLRSMEAAALSLGRPDAAKAIAAAVLRAGRHRR